VHDELFPYSIQEEDPINWPRCLAGPFDEAVIIPPVFALLRCVLSQSSAASMTTLLHVRLVPPRPDPIQG
jgi:hypothetical protein